MGRGGRGRRRKTQASKVDGKTPEDAPDRKRRKTSSSHSKPEKKTNQTKLEVSLPSKDVSDASTSVPSPIDLDCNDHELERLKHVWSYLSTAMFTHQKHNDEPSNETHSSPTLIQRQQWSIMMQTKLNSVSIAPTGSGKTLAYCVPTVLEQELPGVLVLVPTRELVQQVAKVYRKVTKAVKKFDSRPFQIIQIYGGVDRQQQQKQLASAVKEDSNVVVTIATPGRLLDLLQSDASCIPPKLGWIVLDEADQLSKDGDLGPQVGEILELTRSNSETRLALLSATYPEKVRPKFLEWVGPDHVLVQVDHHSSESSNKLRTNESSSAAHPSETESGDAPDEAEGGTLASRNAGTFAHIPSHLEQVLHVCSEHKKPRKLLNTLHKIRSNHSQKRSLPLGIVFFAKIEKLKYLATLLEKEGIDCVELHSQLPTKLRQVNLNKFACGQKPLLLATDVAARGIDIPSIQFVIQYDFPGNLQQYVHRCGRAGRSTNSKSATIYSFFTRNLKSMAADLIELLEANQAWVDPNLRQLAGEDNTQTKRKKTRKPAAQQQSDESDGEPPDDFPELALNRIVLKRAGHVSDASSGSSSDEEDEEVLL